MVSMQKPQTEGIAKEIKQLGKHTMTYGLGNILSRIIGFLLIPLYTHYLTPSDYGVLQLVGLTAEVVGIILNLGIGEAIYRFYYNSRDAAHGNLVVSTAWYSITFIAVPILALLCLVSWDIASWLLEETSQGVYILIALSTLWFNMQVSLTYHYLRVRERSTTYLAVSLAKLIVALFLNILLVVGLNMGLLGIFLSGLITAILFAVLSVPLVLYKVGLRFSWLIARQMIRYTLPIIPSNLANLAMHASDRYFIRAYFSLADAGIYTLGYRLGNVVHYLATTPFMQIWAPRRFVLHNNGAPPQSFSVIATYFVFAITFVALGISIFIHDVIRLISPCEYWYAAQLTPAVTLCYILFAFTHHLGFGILVAKRTEYWAYIKLYVGFINFLLNFILIPLYGPWGAVGATFFTFVTELVLLYRIAIPLFPIPFEWLRISGCICTAIGLYVVSRIIHPTSVWLSLCWDTCVVCSYFPALWLLILTPGEKTHFTKFVAQRVPPHYANYLTCVMSFRNTK